MTSRRENVRRIEQADGQPRQGEEVGRQRAAAQHQAAAGGADRHGRAQRRRPAARQQGVGQHEYGDRGRPASLTHAEPPQHPPQNDRQHHEVLSGDRQNVDDAGANEFFPFRLGHGGIFAEHEGRRRAAGLRRQRIGQRLVGPSREPPPSNPKTTPASRGPAASRPRPSSSSTGSGRRGRARSRRRRFRRDWPGRGSATAGRRLPPRRRRAGRAAAPRSSGERGRNAAVQSSPRRRDVARKMVAVDSPASMDRRGSGSAGVCCGSSSSTPRTAPDAVRPPRRCRCRRPGRRRGDSDGRRRRTPCAARARKASGSRVRPFQMGDEPAEHSSQRQQQAGGKRHGRIAVQHDAGGVGQRGRDQRRTPDAVVRWSLRQRG